MNVKKEYLSPCGMYCGVCTIIAADRDNDQELKTKLASIFGTIPEQITCKGCRSEKTFQFAGSCAIRACADGKHLEGCYQCENFPSDHFKTFPFEIAKKEMMEAIPRWKELGTEQWVIETERHFTFSHCGSLMHRHATQCNRGQTPMV